MLSTAETIKQKLAEVLASGVKQSSIAAHCGVSKQAVQSWKNTGRIDKRHLQALAEISGRPLSWWLELSDEAPATPAAPRAPEQTRANEDSPPYAIDRPKWPFSRINWRQYSLLNTEQRNLVEAYIQGLIDEASRNKSNGTPKAA